LERGDAKKTSCLQLECNPTAIAFKFEEKVLAKGSLAAKEFT